MKKIRKYVVVFEDKSYEVVDFDQCRCNFQSAAEEKRNVLELAQVVFAPKIPVHTHRMGKNAADYSNVYLLEIYRGYDSCKLGTVYYYELDSVINCLKQLYMWEQEHESGRNTFRINGFAYRKDLEAIRQFLMYGGDENEFLESIEIKKKQSA